MDDMHEPKPNSKVAQREGKYVAYENGDFRIETEEVSYRAGSMMSPKCPDAFQVAIEAHEEECRALYAEFLTFG